MALGRIALVSIKGIQREVEKEILGVMSISLDDAVQNGLLELKAYGGTEQRNLPSGYTQVEYIQGDGNSYINTGIALTQDDDCEVVFSINIDQYSRYIFGSRGNDASVNNIALFLGGSPANRAVVDFNNSDYSLYRAGPQVLSASSKYTAIINKNVRGIYENGTAIVENTTACPDTITTGNAIVFGAFSTSYFSGRIYSVKVAGKMNLIPCKDSNDVVGMYDTINGVFYDNDGTGTFTAGPNAVPTPTTPIDIVSNNGVLKFSKNMANVNSQTVLVGYYISAQGVITADANNRIYQDYIPVKPNTTYTLSMSSEVYYVTISEYSTAEDSGFVRRNAGSSGGNTQLTITTGATTNYVRFGTNIDRSEVTLERVLAINWQLEQGDTPTPYVEGGIYVDGTTETIGVHGKNLYNKADGYLYGYPTASNTWTQRTDATSELTIMVKLKEGSTYTVTRAAGSVATFRIQASATSTLTNGQSLVNIDSTGNSAVTTKTFTVPQGAPYVLFYVRNTATQSQLTVDDVINAFQVELGSTATEYAPYFDGGTATAEMLLKVGDNADEQEILSGDITRKVGIKALDGTENWTRIDASSGVPFPTFNLALGTTAAGGISNVPLCSHFRSATSTGRSNIPDNGVGVTANPTYTSMWFRCDAITTTNAFTAWLTDQYNAGTPVIVVYSLATPTTESVTGQTMNIPAGDSTIEITQASINTLELSAKYKALPN